MTSAPSSTPGRIRTAERATGRVLGELPAVEPSSRIFFGGGSLWRGWPVDNGWEVARYELPTSRRTGAVRLPSRGGGVPPGDRGNRPTLSMEFGSAPAGAR